MTHAFIARYPALLASRTCRDVIDKFDADSRKFAGGVEGLGNPKRSLDLGVSRLTDWEDLAAKLHHTIISSALRYRDEHPSFARLHRDIRHTGYQIQMYRSGGNDGFDWHADVVNAATANRFLAMVLYLNTVEIGGETEFLVQDLKVQPVEGTVIWFPPSFAYLHRGHTPITGPKYIVTTFLIDG